MKGMQFVYIFIGSLIGLIFAQPIGDLATDVAANSTGITATIYEYIPVLYALCCLALMVGSIGLFFYGKYRKR